MDINEAALELDKLKTCLQEQYELEYDSDKITKAEHKDYHIRGLNFFDKKRENIDRHIFAIKL